MRQATRAVRRFAIPDGAEDLGVVSHGLTRLGAVAAAALALAACVEIVPRGAPVVPVGVRVDHKRPPGPGSAVIVGVSTPFAPDSRSAIAVDRAGRVWLTIPDVGIVRRNAGGTWTTFRIPHELRKIAIGPDGNAWAIGLSGYHVFRVSPDDRIEAYRTPVFWYGTLLAAGRGCAWLASHASGDVVRLRTDGSVRRFPTGMKKIKALASDARSDVIFIGENPGKRVTPAGLPLDDDFIGGVREDGTVTKRRAADAASSVAPALAVDGAGAAWFTACGAIDWVSAAGAISRFPLARSGSCPPAVAVSPVGEAWFADPQAREIGRVSRRGSVDVFVPSPSRAIQALAVDQRGHVWVIAPHMLGELQATRSYAPIRRANAGP